MADIRKSRLDSATLAENFCDLQPPLNAMQAQQEAARCLFCFDAPCVEACPTGIDIPGFIRKISSGNLLGSATTILEANIMGGTCAKVCPVEELCEQVCVRNTAEDQPVVIGRLQDHATAHLFARGVQPWERQTETGRSVAVVGAGPAGLACAHALALRGHAVTVFESRPKGGGLNEYGIAAYKMTDERAARELDFILGIGGIELRCDEKLGVDVLLDELRQDHDAVFLGLGHTAVNSLGLENESAPGIHSAVDYIARLRQSAPQDMPVGRDVVVIGGGNTAIDIAIQTRKLGAESVTLVYRRGQDDMGATDHEQELAQTNGVLIRTWASPRGFKTDADGVRAVEFDRMSMDEDGRLSGTGEVFELAADQVFKAIGQRFEASPFEGSEAPDMEHSRIIVDDQRRTSLENVWAGGDCVPGRDLTVVAVEDGKQAALSIHATLTEE